ncbi:hypothetical protein CASFOL_006488 [Castilleja foliolosa]|uniref:F-box domain-containing protein n=1 Tax=Castilleja foliolosa TaxID=1961234 RepID=A0ABD3E6H7_9LAMI
MKPNSNIPNELLSSAQIVASIDDLLTEIFLRLPMKSLCRFKLVSKNWDSIISDPGFSLLRNPDPNPSVGLIFSVPTSPSKGPYAKVLSFDKSTNPQIRTLENFSNPFPCKILSSCNGLLLISSISGTYNCGYPVRYFICNPTTGKYFGLPETDEREDYVYCFKAYLAFDPSRSPHYKVVCARELPYNKRKYQYQYQLEVYSSETGCWRKFGGPLSGHVNFSRGVYLNGAIHWISYYSSMKSSYIKLDDDDDEMPHEMPTPPHAGSTPYYYFGESCGRLHFIQGHMEVNVMVFNVLEMSTDYSEWFVKYKIDNFNFTCRDFKICSLVWGKKDEDSFLVFKFPGEFLRCNLADRTFETIYKFNGSNAKKCLQYIESLCSTYVLPVDL